MIVKFTLRTLKTFGYVLSISLNDNLAPAVRCFPLISTNFFFVTGFAATTFQQLPCMYG